MLISSYASVNCNASQDCNRGLTTTEEDIRSQSDEPVWRMTGRTSRIYSSRSSQLLPHVHDIKWKKAKRTAPKQEERTIRIMRQWT